MDENKRKHILITAMKLFNENGFHATPTSLIAKKAKVSVGTLFNYYPTKEILIQAIYLDIKVHSKLLFLEMMEDHKSHHDRLLSMWKAVINWGINNPEEFHYTELFLNSPFIRSLVNEKVMDAYKKFRISIFEAISPNTVCGDYPEYSIYYIDHAIHATTRFILNNQIENRDHFIRSSFDLLWFGFSEDKYNVEK
jgi:AcrR family transcriptional regulator